MQEFLDSLASKEPVPGGGGASALIGAVSCSLCSMVSNLTLGKKKYAEYQDRIQEYLLKLTKINQKLVQDIKKDADAFAPLARAYAIPKDDPDRESIMEEALVNAAKAPMGILKDLEEILPIMEDLCVIGSKLAISDVAVAATACRAAYEGAVMNIFINTKSMKNRTLAQSYNNQAEKLVSDGVERCNIVYRKILEGMI